MNKDKATPIEISITDQPGINLRDTKSYFQKYNHLKIIKITPKYLE